MQLLRKSSGCSDSVRDCFITYVTTKVVKQTEDFKVRYTKEAKPRRILLPLSLGVSSVTLLHLLNEQYARQRQKTTRTGFELLVLLIIDHAIDPEDSDTRQTYKRVKARFPSHEYALLSTHEIFRYHSNLGEIISPDLYVKPAQGEFDSNSTDPEEKLVAFLSSISSASSKDDLLRILRLRLIVAYAKEKSCECIVWGDSTTRLAEKTLSETAKGRGFSLPWQTGDGRSPYGIEFKFPMRGLLRKEIVLFSTLTSPTLTNLIIDESKAPSSSVSSKELTIDALMGRYFASVENNYPSIVTNVVRTANRLQAPEPSISNEPCEMCGMPHEAELGISLDKLGQPPDSLSDSPPGIATGSASRRSYCHGCSISLLNIDRRK